MVLRELETISSLPDRPELLFPAKQGKEHGFQDLGQASFGVISAAQPVGQPDPRDACR